MEVCVLQEAGASSRLFSACLLQHFGIAEVMRRAGRASGTRQQVGTLVVEGTEWTGTGVLVLQEPSWSWHSRWAFHRSACFLFPLLRFLTSITKELNWGEKIPKAHRAVTAKTRESDAKAKLQQVAAVRESAQRSPGSALLLDTASLPKERCRDSFGSTQTHPEVSSAVTIARKRERKRFCFQFYLC